MELPAVERLIRQERGVGWSLLCFGLFMVIAGVFRHDASDTALLLGFTLALVGGTSVRLARILAAIAEQATQRDPPPPAA